jgi:zinc/manganese transport system substrate-binding protein
MVFLARCSVPPLPLAGEVDALARARRVGEISQLAPVYAEAPPPQPSPASGRGGSPPPLRHRANTLKLAMRYFWFVFLALVTFACPVRADEYLNVVASFSILGDLAKNAGGDRVSVTTLVDPDGDVHVYTPTPADAKKIADAKLVIINGLGLEGWLPRLVQSSGSKAAIVTATANIAPRKLGDAADPHAWQSVGNAKIYVANIRDALATVDPAGAEAYRRNAQTYLEKLDALDREVRDATALIPESRRKVISTHAAFGYFAAAYGIEFLAPLGVSTESEPSAHDIAGIITQIKAAKIPAVFPENISDLRLIQRIAAETGAHVGGTLYSDSLTAEKGDAPTYIELVRHNIRALTRALAN